MSVLLEWDVSDLHSMLTEGTLSQPVQKDEYQTCVIMTRGQQKTMEREETEIIEKNDVQRLHWSQLETRRIWLRICGRFFPVESRA